jgi:dephospho-CoA kinase
MREPDNILVVGIVGPKASGKDTAARYLEKKYGACSHHYSEIYKQILSILDIPISRDSLIKLVDLRKAFGEDVLNNALNMRILEEGKAIEVVTGIRFDNELQNIRNFPKNVIIAIDSPIELRFERQTKRDLYADDKNTLDYFIAMEQRETEIHIDRLSKNADYTIVNDGTFEELDQKIDQIMEKVLKEKMSDGIRN